MEPRSDRVIELLDILTAMEFLCSNNNPHRAPRLVHGSPVSRIQFTPLIQNSKGHHVPTHGAVTDFFNFFDPARSHPCPRALRLEPSISYRLCHGAIMSLAEICRRRDRATAP